MTDLHEQEAGAEIAYLGLPEIEANGVGAVYEVDGVQIAPIGVYAGDGMFVGIYVSDSTHDRTLRLAQEEHHDLQVAKTLLPIRLLESEGRLNPQDPPNVIPRLVTLVHNFYQQKMDQAKAAGQTELSTPPHLPLDEFQKVVDLYADLDARFASGQLVATSRSVLIDV